MTSETSTIEPNETATEATKTVRPKYSEVCDASELNSDGLLTGLPQAYDPSQHKSPRAKDFADGADYYEFRAMQAELEAEELKARADKDRNRAADLRKYGDPATRKSVDALRKQMQRLEDLKSQLAKDGVDVSEFGL